MKLINLILTLILFILTGASMAADVATPFQQLRINKFAAIQNGQFVASFKVPRSAGFTLIIPNADDFLTNNISIMTPDNKVLDASNFAAFGVEFSQFSPDNELTAFLATGNSWIIKFSDVIPGSYTVRGVTSSAKSHLPIRVLVKNSDIALHLVIGSPSNIPMVNHHLPISVLMVDGDLPYINGNVSFEIFKDGEALQHANIRDDGVYPDYQANDGTYSTLFMPLSAGVYDVLINISGRNKNGDKFEAQIFRSFKVLQDNVYLTGKHSEVLIDEDGDGYNDALMLEFETGGVFQEEGVYYITVNLETNDGRTLVAHQRIESPEKKFYVKFDGKYLGTLDYSGAFKFFSIVIEYNDSIIHLNQSFGSTSYYDHDSWERDDLLYLGNVTFEPIYSADGRFIEMIDVSFEVDTLPTAARFGYSATITTVGNEHVGVYGNPDIELKKGINRITFSIPAADFAKLQSNTALKISQLTMYPLIKGGNVISKRNVATSELYSCWDFRGCSTAENAIPVAVDDEVTSTGKAMYIHVAQNDYDGDLLKVSDQKKDNFGTLTQWSIQFD
ncbi:choice-of-anchor X domain-containing protein [Shewanella loihica]|nr:choice-of-anchor X domain-containing protein [Shewanella loihica]